MKINNSKGRFFGILGATIAVALCCFTPILVFVLTTIGLGVWISYLDYILLPLLGALIGLTIWSYFKYRKDCNCQK
ncbi:mercury resistance system transport protein MerF [Cyanobacterium aponinum UTEX 3221]|uniref:mercury resistance system transport protein MerF n=1 Tax=Cyanobacterium aponinum TaxID=379064 RepID=UPI002B4C1C56|nr:mercury resistance system transport protein MerF [Cyanobacterium aponinum]WRL38167.1 mercury resistance system transport protein MerF [Cyanobacterium aponinum UTEX 3221]